MLKDIFKERTIKERFEDKVNAKSVKKICLLLCSKYNYYRWFI
jgi:hypothetical protein